MIDITRPLGVDTAAWPGDTPFSLKWTSEIDEGDVVSVSRLVLSPHVGTHADAPAHYLPDGEPAGEFTLSAFVGPVRVVDLAGTDAVTEELLLARGAIGEERVLVRSLETVRPEIFAADFPPLMAPAAVALIDAGLRLYGTDAPSVDAVNSQTMEAHRALGRAGIPILENLDLSAVEPGLYDLVALPLPLIEAEAAPVRAVLLPAGSLRTG